MECVSSYVFCANGGEFHFLRTKIVQFLIIVLFSKRIEYGFRFFPCFEKVFSEKICANTLFCIPSVCHFLQFDGRITDAPVQGYLMHHRRPLYPDQLVDIRFDSEFPEYQIDFVGRLHISLVLPVLSFVGGEKSCWVGVTRRV